LNEVTLRRAWIAAVVALAALIVVASLSPQPVVPGEAFSDKAGHYLAYLMLALLGSGIASPATLWRTMFRCFLLGAGIETAQALLTETRQAEWADLAANTAGILTAWLVAAQGRAGWGLRAAGWFARRRVP
jgi:VanZ family protein